MAQATIATTVTGLQGHPVATTAPSIVGQLLTWNGSAWAPDNTTYMPVAGGTFTGPVTLSGPATTPNEPVTLTQAATAVGANIGRNYVHNTQFIINQRGSAAYSGTAPFSTLTLDRWWISCGAANDTATVNNTSASDADRAAIGDEVARNYPSCVFTGGTAAANYVAFYQNIENVQRMSDKTFTLSFWAYSPTSLRLGLGYAQGFGLGGSPSATVTGNIGVTALTTGWTRYQFTFTLPSTAGKTFGTTANSSWTQIVFWLSCPSASASYPNSGNLGNQSGTINIWGVQVEFGSQTTPFEHRDPEIELALCQRYYETGIAQNNSIVPSTTTGNFGQTTSYAVTKRATPTVTLSNTAYVGGATGLTATPQGISSIMLGASITSSSNVQVSWATTWAASADL